MTELTAGKSEFLLHLQQQSLAQEDTREVEMVKGKKESEEEGSEEGSGSEAEVAVSRGSAWVFVAYSGQHLCD